MSELRLAIGGMSCAACVKRVERALQKVPGVDHASVNLATERADVQLAAGRMVSPAALVAAVKAAGYEAQPLTAAGRPADPDTLHRHDFRGWHVIVSGLLTLPLLLPMLAMAAGVHAAPVPGWLQALLATVVQFGFGARFYRDGWNAVRAGTGNMDLLVAIGTSAAWLLSLWHLPALWSSAPWAGSSASAHAMGTTASHLYFESSASVITLVLLGKWLEQRARRRASAAIGALGALRPEQAIVRVDGADRPIPSERLQPGDLLVVRAGERIAADGEIIEGRSDVDESMITGEGLPVGREAGQRVTGGSLNGDGLLLVRVDAVGAQSTLSRIIELVESAQASKPAIQRIVDQVSAVFVPVVLVVSACTLAGWVLAGAGWQTAWLNAVAVLVIACPCALGLATPAAIIAGTGVAARHGILISDPQALETAHRVGRVVFDKTGTLTTGQPRLQALALRSSGNAGDAGPAPAEAQQPWSEQQATGLDDQGRHWLAIAAALQAGSDHPLAKATLSTAQQLPLDVAQASDLQALPGRGVQGRVGDQAWLLGNARLMAEHGIAIPQGATVDWGERGWTISWLARLEGPQRQEGPEEAAPAGGGKPAWRLQAALAFGDQLKPGAAQAVAALLGQRIECSLLTGDNAASAARVASAAGIRDVHADVLPDGKRKVIDDLKSHGEIVAMVGDGINDAPALAAADVGMAMASGTDVAMQSAGIVLMRSDPMLVPAAIDISRRTWGKIRQNLFWALVYNAVGIPLAAFGRLDPMLAGLAMALSSVSVISNALLLRRWHPAMPGRGRLSMEIRDASQST